MKCILTIVCLALSQGLLAQTDDLGFLIGKIKTAYAGYRDSAAFDSLVREVRATPQADTFADFSRLANYFKDDHLKVFAIVKAGRQDSAEAAANRRRFGTGGSYWLSSLNDCVLYFEGAGNGWRGYIAESKGKLPVGMEVLRMTKDTGGLWQADYKDPGFQYRVITTAWFKTPDVLVGRSWFKYRKIGHYTPGMLAGRPAFDFTPSIKALDSQTVLFRMPYFEPSMAKTYADLIKTDSVLLGNARTLIVDIRGNPGGSIRCFLPLFPYVCTGEMRETGGQQRASQALIDDERSSLEAYEKKGDTARVNVLRPYIDTLLAHKGSFYTTGNKVFPCQPIPNHIEHVAVLMDHVSRSAAELLILYFRQSKKVRFFGEPSGGAIDYLDEISYWLPHMRYQFWVASTKRVPTATEPLYDSRGIPPDVSIGDDVDDWVEWVRQNANFQ